MKATLLSLACVLLAIVPAQGQADQTWIDLDGVNDHLDLGADPILAGRTTFTVEMRVHFDDPTGEYTIIGQRTTDLNRTFVIQRWSGALYILFDGANYASCPFTPCTTEWYQLSAVYDGTGATNSDRLAFHVNGVAQALTFTGTIPAATLVTSPPADLVLGCEHNGPGTQLQFLNGQFGELRIWDHAMSALEILDRMPFEVAGTEPGLLEYFRFADGVPGGDNTGIASFAGGHGVSTIVPVGLAMTGAASNFTGAPAMTGAIDVSVAVAGHILTAAAAGATYQWLDCDNGLAPIPGATAQSYTTTADGNYAVTITQGGCSATSACVAVVTTGITTADASGWTVHPNPVEDRLFVELGNGAAQPFAIMDPAGRIVRQGQVIGRAIIPVEDLTPGIYLLRIGTGSAKVFERK